MLDLFAAVKARYLATDLATSTNGIAVQEELTDVPRPYLIAQPTGDSPSSRTNVGDYDTLSFEIHVIADDFQAGTVLAYQVRDRVLNPKLYYATTHGRSMLIQKGSVRWRKEDQYWRFVVEFTCFAAVAQPSRN